MDSVLKAEILTVIKLRKGIQDSLLDNFIDSYIDEVIETLVFQHDLTTEQLRYFKHIVINIVIELLNLHENEGFTSVSQDGYSWSKSDTLVMDKYKDAINAILKKIGLSTVEGATVRFIGFDNS